MPNVKTVQDRSKGALLILDDGVKVWTPDKELARTLLGKPIPEDWTRRENENGPMALPPKPRGAGGMTAWRNTKEGFEAEASGRRRWQEIEEERRDRRTALMQAVGSTITGDENGGSVVIFTDAPSIIERAELYYDWLRESSPAAGPAAQPAGVATTEASPRTPPQAGAPTSAAIREGAADTGPGGDSAIGTPPGSTNYPNDPLTCDHKYGTGAPAKVKVGKRELCRLCGMDWVSAMEGTTADLGPA